MKASRVVNQNSDEPLYDKALSKNTPQPFLMNFQQLKLQYCDVFIWLAVFRDEIGIWVMNSQEVANHRYYFKGQHKSNLGNEGQLHMIHDNIAEFVPFLLRDNDIVATVKQVNLR